MKLKQKYIFFIALTILLQANSGSVSAFEYKKWARNKDWPTYWKEARHSTNEEFQLMNFANYKEAFTAARERNIYFFTYRNRRFNSFRGSEWRKIVLNLGRNTKKVKHIPSKYLSAALLAALYETEKKTYIKTPEKIYRYSFKHISSKHQKRKILSLIRAINRVKQPKENPNCSVVSTRDNCPYYSYDTDRIHFEISTKPKGSYENETQKITLHYKYLSQSRDLHSKFHITSGSGSKYSQLRKAEVVLEDIPETTFISENSTIAKYLLKPILFDFEKKFEKELGYKVIADSHFMILSHTLFSDFESPRINKQEKGKNCFPKNNSSELLDMRYPLNYFANNYNHLEEKFFKGPEEIDLVCIYTKLKTKVNQLENKLR